MANATYDGESFNSLSSVDSLESVGDALVKSRISLLIKEVNTSIFKVISNIVSSSFHFFSLSSYGFTMTSF